MKMDGYPDSNHVRFAPFDTICFHAISRRYLQQTSSYLIGKLKSFVMGRMSFNEHAKNPIKWTSVVESAWHDLQGGIKRFDPEALTVMELVLDVYTPATTRGLSGLPASTSSIAIALSLLVRFCSLSSTITDFTFLCL